MDSNLMRSTRDALGNLARVLAVPAPRLTRTFTLTRSRTLALALALAAAAAAVCGCGGGEDPGQDRFEVREAVRAWVEAGRSGDRAGFVALLASEDREAAAAEDYVAMIQESPGLEYGVSDVRVEGDRASAHLSIAEAGELEALDILLVREEGEWRIREQASLELLADALRRQLMPMLDEMQGSLPDPEAGDPSALSEVLGGDR